MRLNLGCGNDIREGYVNVDFRDLPGAVRHDLSRIPWPWENESADEILMLDFLEHFPYRRTASIIVECWRILKPGGTVVIQVPDFDHTARALMHEGPFVCNKCEKWVFSSHDTESFKCGGCGHDWDDIAEAAVGRLYGGQDYEGNWHQTAFTKLTLNRILQKYGFGEITYFDDEALYTNWTLKLRATKTLDIWGDK